jgi:translation initiation factor 2B subunit (eIF-2B alpha/beta/delta family)
MARVHTAGSATAAGSLAARNLAELVEGIGTYAPEGYPDAIREIADELLRRQPAMAPIVGLVNTVYLGLSEGPGVVAVELRSTADRMATSSGLLAEVGAGLVEDGSAVLTHGGSSSVKGMLLRAAQDRSVSVACAVTMPAGEGIELAADLAAEGLRVEVVPDDQVSEALPGVDLVVMGTTAFGPDQALTVAGSADIVEHAGAIGLPLFVVASVEKALPGLLFDRAVQAGSAAGEYQAIPLSAISGVITEAGVLDPQAAGKLAGERRVAPELTR